MRYHITCSWWCSSIWNHYNPYYTIFTWLCHSFQPLMHFVYSYSCSYLIARMCSMHDKIRHNWNFNCNGWMVEMWNWWSVNGCRCVAFIYVVRVRGRIIMWNWLIYNIIIRPIWIGQSYETDNMPWSTFEKIATKRYYDIEQCDTHSFIHWFKWKSNHKPNIPFKCSMCKYISMWLSLKFSVWSHATRGHTRRYSKIFNETHYYSCPFQMHTRTHAHMPGCNWISFDRMCIGMWFRHQFQKKSNKTIDCTEYR